jgi:hypothetical protein
MSLVGSLEDLGLGEILQIISLSRKSGTLRLRAQDGKGWILFRNGEIRAAELAGGPTGLAELLVARGALAPALGDRLSREARERGGSFADLVTREGAASLERIAALRLEHVEATVLSMFQWSVGEFSFEIGPPGESPGDPDLVLAAGVNPQFLALEGTRLQDEGRVHGDAPPGPAAGPEAEAKDPDPDWSAGADTAFSGGGALSDLPPAAAWGRDAHARPTARRASVDGEPAAVIVIEPELPELERIKLGLADEFPRVHIFQRSDLGIERIRHYLARRETPVVLLSSRTPADPLSGARDWREILGRLKGQAPRMPVLVMAMQAGDADLPPASLDGVLARPEPGRERELGARLREHLSGLHEEPDAAPAGTGAADELADAPPSLSERLDAAAARLGDPSFRGEVLPLVLRLAAELFSRVAIFMIRDGAALGMAQVGLPRAGGPDESGIRRLALRADEPAWFRQALESRAPVCGPPSDAGDHHLAELLGGAPAERAFVAPLATGNAVVALLYADNLPDDAPLPETGALEALLRAAGLALDRALRERARG